MDRTPLKILLLKAGETVPEAIRTVGDHERWFETALAQEPVALEVVRPYAGEPLPPPRSYAAVMITGSPLSAIAPAPWMEAAAVYLRRAVDAGVPVLGVCFGHQLLGLAFGARVIRNPRGREMGTVRICLTGEGRRDPLFDGLGAEIAVQATHEDVIADPPADLVPLAENDATPWQAFRVGECGRGVQFHPELSDAGLAALAEARRAVLDREGEARGLGPNEGSRRVIASIGPTPAGRTILANFVRWARRTRTGPGRQ